MFHNDNFNHQLVRSVQQDYRQVAANHRLVKASGARPATRQAMRQNMSSPNMFPAISYAGVLVGLFVFALII